MENDLYDACNNILSDAKWILMVIGFTVCGLCFLSQFGMSVLVECAKTALKLILNCFKSLVCKICTVLYKCCACLCRSVQSCVCMCCGKHTGSGFEVIDTEMI